MEYNQEEQKEYDEERDKKIKCRDLILLRLTNDEVINDFEKVIQKIKELI